MPHPTELILDRLDRLGRENHGLRLAGIAAPNRATGVLQTTTVASILMIAGGDRHKILRRTPLERWQIKR